MASTFAVAPQTVRAAHARTSNRPCDPAVVVASSHVAEAYRHLVVGQRSRLQRDSAKLTRYRRAGRRARLSRSVIGRTNAEIRLLEHDLACETRYVMSSPTQSEPPTNPDRLPSELSPQAPPLSALASAKELSIAVSGNHLVDASGQPVTLHGVDISGTEWQCLYGQAFYGPSDNASIAAMADWHINAVRIPLNEDCWLGINGAPTDIETYHNEIAEYVKRLNAHGMYAILDLHWSAPGTILSHLGAGFEGYFEMADESHSPAFWASIASYFKSNHALLFDLVNEPNDISWSCWRNGCIAPRGYQTAGMQQLVDAVRATGATQPVMVAGLEDAAEAGKAWLENRPTDPGGQLVASVHVYSQASISHFNTNIGTVAAQFPVVAGEIGEMDCADEDINAFLPWADSHGISYLAWAWYVGECASYPSLISSYNGTPTNFGIGYREHLLATFPAP